MRAVTAIVRAILLCSTLLLLCKSASAFCNVPQIRLDDEFFVSDIVFTGTIVADRKIGLTREGFFEARVFTWRVDTVLRGAITSGQQVKTFTGNDSARFPLESGAAGSLAGRSFLVFAFRDEQHAGSFAIDNCGNSVPLRAAKSKISEIKALPLHHGGLLYGSMMDGDAGVRITAKGSVGSFSTATKDDGSFQINVPPGHYSVIAERPGKVFSKTDIAYKDPNDVVVPDGGSAGLSFREKGR